MFSILVNCVCFADEKTKRRIFNIHTGKMTLAQDVNVEEYITAKDDLSGADIKAICTEAGLMALRYVFCNTRFDVYLTAFKSDTTKQ